MGVSSRRAIVTVRSVLVAAALLPESSWAQNESLVIPEEDHNDTTAQPIPATACLTSINTLAVREASVMDTYEPRMYSICPFSEFHIGALDFHNELVDGQEMMPLRANLHVQCGPDGSRQNKCIFRGGDVQVDGTHYFGRLGQESQLHNVTIQGMTFEGAQEHSVWLTRPGNVVFRDCEFWGGKKPILLDFFSSQHSSEELTVTFEDCLFTNTTYQHENGQQTHQPALIVGNSRQNRLILHNNRFTNNDFVASNPKFSQSSALIETSGPLTMTMNCFENNTVGVSPVVLYGSAQSSLLALNHEVESKGRLCPMAARYETDVQFDAGAPRCFAFDAPECYIGVNLEPTFTPTTLPEPSAAPSWPYDPNSNDPGFTWPPALGPILPDEDYPPQDGAVASSTSGAGLASWRLRPAVSLFKMLAFCML